MATLAEIRDGYNRLNTRLVRGAGRISSNVYRQLGSWREDDIPRFLKIVGPQLDGLKLRRYGGHGRDRTFDTRIKSPLLYH